MAPVADWTRVFLLQAVWTGLEAREPQGTTLTAPTSSVVELLEFLLSG